VKSDVQPAKIVKSRAVSLKRKREAEMAKLNAQNHNNQEFDGSSTELYGEWQTDLYTPDPIVNVRPRAPSPPSLMIEI
jgi:hypothetical protein